MSDPQTSSPLPPGPFAFGFGDDPYSLYATMRQGQRALRFGSFEIFLLTRYDEVLSAFKRPEIFSSMAFREARPELLQMRGASPAQIAAFTEVMLPGVPMVLNTDPPEHGRYRGILNRGFTPREIGRIEPRIREITAKLVDDILAKGGTTDLVSELTVPLR
jgi:cytochrome P450